MDKEIKQIYIKSNNESKMDKNFTYKKINVKHNKNKKYSVDNIVEDKKENISLPDNYTNKNNTFIMRNCLRKEFDNNNLENNNKSFDAQRKQIFNKTKEIPASPANKLKELYNKYDKQNYSTNTYNKKVIIGSQSINKIESPREKQIENYIKKNYKNQNKEINKTSKTIKLKGS